MGILAFTFVSAQSDYAQHNPELSLSCLNKRANVLSKIADPVKREHYCVGLSAMCRRLDRTLAPDARIYISDVLGQTNISNGGYYFFFKNYLFPRDVEISIDTNAICTDNGFAGTPCDSPDELRARGFDLLIRCDQGFKFIPLSRKGLPR